MATGRDFSRTILMLSAGLGALLLAPRALAAAAPEGANTVDEVIVTGSLIKGTATDAALPVSVIGHAELQKKGSPTVLDLIKSLPESSGVLGDTNQFDSRAQGTAGMGSINLRGLGDQRTLVLLNGHRLSINPVENAGSGGVDTNLLPVAAIDRVEVLKDGAAATYGSDAIAGVVNFITRTRFNGLEVATDYRQINGSDGDYTASGLWGWVGDRLDVMATVGYEHRSQLEVLARDFANPTYLQNPQGGYTPVGNPGSYLPLNSAYTPIGAIQRDVNCSALGGFAGFSGSVPVCYARSTLFDNLVEDEGRFQFFGTLNYRINDHIKAYLEGLYAQTDDPRLATGPTQPIVQNPSAEAALAPSLAGRFFVPASNPGFGSYVAANPGIFPAGTAGAQLIAWRALFLGGNPLFGGTGASEGSAHYQAFRVVGGFEGDIGHGVNFDVRALAGFSESLWAIFLRGGIPWRALGA
jgi:iron complex outermembrane recepter protein